MSAWPCCHAAFSRPRLIAVFACALLLTVAAGPACRRAAAPSGPHARNIVLITIDTLRADHVGAYGYGRARTPTLDSIARSGVLFERAYAAAPITLPSHATMMTGRYPPGHGARDNGMHVSPAVPTIAATLKARGFRTGAFVAAFPLDHQFGLGRGFDVYSDRLPRGPDGKLANERPGSQVVDEALAWLGTVAPGISDPAPRTSPPAPFFAWVHLFEPHVPYGSPPAEGQPSGSTLDRYDAEIATADRQIGRLIAALAPVRDETAILVAGDHGEAFGEHGEYAHSIFVYDTTLRVPFIVAGPGIPAGRRVDDPVTLADIAPTLMSVAGGAMKDADGIDLSAPLGGGGVPPRELYAESLAPLVEFGWAPLRAIRSDGWKYVAAPKPELFEVGKDAGERDNVVDANPAVARRLAARAARYGGDTLPAAGAQSAETLDRLRALGYSPHADTGTNRPDPKDRRELAARIAQVVSGELTGPALVSALEGILREDPQNGQANLRLGYVRLQEGDCTRAEPAFRRAAAAGLPTADVYLGLAVCLGRRGDMTGAGHALDQAERIEPSSPTVLANRGILEASKGNAEKAIAAFQAALAADPGLHEARFNLALVYARAGRRTEALAAAQELLARLPATAPQRPEVEKLIAALR